MKPLTIATRGSKLALWQAEHVRARIIAAFPGTDVGLLVLKTRGDAILDMPLAQIGGKGLFVKEIEEALLDGRADLAVHSMKDVPMDLPPGLALGAILDRFDSRDMFLSARYPGIRDLPEGARVGTSSLRRAAQVLALRQDAAIVPLRGNVDTRLRKLMDGEFDAVVMAAAGIRRLRLAAPHMRELEPAVFLPAAGQGALGVECREGCKELGGILEMLDHAPSRACVEAERAFLRELDGGCHTPIAAHAAMEGTALSLAGRILSLDGGKVAHGRIELTVDGAFSIRDAAALGTRLAGALREDGGGSILEEIAASA